jgi:hypothetical protein
MKVLTILAVVGCAILVAWHAAKDDNGGIQPGPAGSLKKSWTATELAQLVTDLSPWTTPQNYHKRDWDKMLEVAAVFQSADSNLAVQAFDQFSAQNANDFHDDYLESSKAYLLLLVVFDLPEHAKGYPSRGAGWLAQRRDVNSDGTVNLDWPIKWNGGKPFLTSEYIGYEGIPYSPGQDYRFLASQFKMRNLPHR